MELAHRSGHLPNLRQVGIHGHTRRDFSAEGNATVERARQVLDQYDVGALIELSPVSSGLMHRTYRVDTAAGGFILQRLHPKLSTPEIIADYRAVTAHLMRKGHIAPRLQLTRNGRPVATDPSGAWWRLTTRVPGRTVERVESAAQAEQCARALGRFHCAVADLDYRFVSQHPLHDTEGHLARLRAAAAAPAHAEALAPIADEVRFIVDRLSSLLFPAELPRRVVHGDPKISNVMFEGDDAVALIDLDTCNRHTILVDLGDAVRSWCRDGAEDERQAFHLDRFAAILRGYAAEGPPLDPSERAHLPLAGRIITLELASRFARDVLEDEYFGFDPARYPTRRAQNHARMLGMLHLAADIQAQQSQVDAMVAAAF